jgi:amino acid transporter
MAERRTIGDDDAYLRQFGVEPRLKRAIGFVSSSLFAIAFQGPTTGALLITGATLALGGPAFIWAIPLIFLFQLVVALTWAELSSHYPLSGGIYQWAKYLGGEGLGWVTGIFYLVAILLVMPAVGLVISVVLSSLFTAIPFNPQSQIVMSLLAIVGTALIMATSVRIVALINNVGVTLELIVLGGAAILLLGHVHQPLSVLFTTGGTDAGQSYVVPFLVVVALVITQLVGFETAGAFAEETRDSRVSPSRAIMTALAGAALFLFVFDFALVLSLPDVGRALKEPETVIPLTLNANLGDFGAKAFLVGAFISVSSTSIATLAAIVRTMYGMARDNQLPGSSYLTRLSARTDEPVIAIVVAALLSMIPLLFVQQIPVIVAAISALILVPYFLVLAALIRRRLRGWPSADAPFKLGSWGMPAAVVGIVWVALVGIDAAWPRAATNPNLGPFPIIEEFAVVIAVLGALWWFLVLRHRVAPVISPEQPEADPAGARG